MINRKSFLKNSLASLGILSLPKLIKSEEPLPLFSNKNGEPKLVGKESGTVLNVLGDVQTHKLNGQDTNNLYCEWHSEVEPGVGIPPHYHTKEDEVFRVIQGTLEFVVDGKVIVANEGDIVYAPRNIPHTWKVTGTKTAHFISSAFPAGIEHMFEKLAALPAGPPDLAKVGMICNDYGIHFV